jgi:hypothetical protein
VGKAVSTPYLCKIIYLLVISKFSVYVKIIRLSETLLSENKKKPERETLHTTVSLTFSSFNHRSNPEIQFYTCCTKLAEVYG